MKKWLLIPLYLLLTTVAVSEPIDPNPDGIGIYADLEGRVNQIDVEAGEPLEAYVLVTRPSGGGPAESQFAGVEFTVVVPDNVTIWGWSTPLPGTMVWTTAPEFMMNFNPLVPYTEVIHVLTFIIVPTNDEPAQFYLTELGGQTGVDLPRYSDSDRFLLYDLTPYPGGCENMSFVVNGGIVPETTTSWSDLKALYR